MNEYDSMKVLDLMREQEKFEVTDNENEADLLVLNTCSIREKAQEKVFHQVGRWKKMRGANPDVKIAVGGCVASQEGENLRKRAPDVDIVFGPQSLHRLPELYRKEFETGRSQVDISFPKLEKFDLIPKSDSTDASAFVSVMEGCNKYCSFCVVPKTRGHEVSRSVHDILDEVEHLVKNGAREIHYLGQNVNNFKGQHHEAKLSLAALIRLTGEIDGVERIRFTTSHPHEFKPDLVEAYSLVPQLVSHVHLPVQSGSDRILKLMRRRYDVTKYLSLIEDIRKVRPDMSFSSDFIVGFPGETKDDFQATLDLVEDVKFDESFSFIYSPRPNTTAAEMEDSVPIEEKKERLAILQEKLNKLSFSYSRRMMGSTQRCLVTGPSKKDPGELQGRTINNRIVNFKRGLAKEGDLVDLEIVDVFSNSLRGRLRDGDNNLSYRAG